MRARRKTELTLIAMLCIDWLLVAINWAWGAYDVLQFHLVIAAFQFAAGGVALFSARRAQRTLADTRRPW